jgi:hypothetical protein
MRWRQAGQTTTEYLMISGLITVIAIVLLTYVFGRRTLLGGCSSLTIQCVLQRVVDGIINDPAD